MTHEFVMTWIIRLMGFAAWVIVVCASILITGFAAGYATETYAIKNARCINSACDQPCKPGARFVRHQGCGEVK
jgi:hypothetical protein